jgi:hypothetical protein
VAPSAISGCKDSGDDQVGAEQVHGDHAEIQDGHGTLLRSFRVMTPK